MCADSTTLPTPNNEEEFVGICLELWRDVWGDPNAQRHGRRGQGQSGVDIISLRPGKRIGVQCKQRNHSALTPAEISKEVRLAHAFRPSLDELIFAVTREADTKLQQCITELNLKHQEEGSFSISFWSWRDICEEIDRRPTLRKQIYEKYYRQFLDIFATPSEPIDFGPYRQAMSKHYGRVKIEELDPDSQVNSIRLTDLYIPPNGRECLEFLPQLFALPKELKHRLAQFDEFKFLNLDDETVSRYRQNYIDEPSRPILDVLNDSGSRRVVIIGDPGSGKSSLLQFKLLQWAEKIEHHAPGAAVPFLIELREYARFCQQSGMTGFFSFLYKGAAARWHLNENEFQNWLKANPGIALFDALDEVFDPGLRREVATSIHRFADEFPKTQIVVTSRVFGFEHQQWLDEGFQVFMLDDLDDLQIDAFLTRWFAKYQAVSERRNRLAASIRDFPAIRQLAGNPLLLSMMAILDQTQELPSDRLELYGKCARLLLDRWKTESTFVADVELSKAALDGTDKFNLLMRIAKTFQLSENGLASNLIHEDVLVESLAEGLRGIPHLRPERAARALINQLRGRNFIISSVGGNCYAFVHRTFLEYFCAAEIHNPIQSQKTLTFDQLRVNFYERYWNEEHWHETPCLLAGVLPPDIVTTILESLLELPDPEQLSNNIYLAAQCIRETKSRDYLGATEQKVLQRMQSLACIRIEEALSDEVFNTTLVRKLARYTSMRTRALTLLGSVWQDSPTIISWLKSCIDSIKSNSVENPPVGNAIVSVIARTQRDSPETLIWLYEIIWNGTKAEAQAAAVHEIARGWRNHPGVLASVKALITSGTSIQARCAAVQELARNWKDDPQTFSILIDRAQSDIDGGVRATALNALAAGWKNALGKR